MTTGLVAFYRASLWVKSKRGSAEVEREPTAQIAAPVSTVIVRISGYTDPLDGLPLDDLSGGPAQYRSWQTVPSGPVHCAKCLPAQRQAPVLGRIHLRV
jgi:hypothetical protein